MPSAVPPPVDKQAIAAIVARATAWRRTKHQRDPEYATWSQVAFVERVTGVPREPRPLADGWWVVGRVVDEIAEQEFEVLVNPDETRIRLRAVIVRDPNPPRPSPVPVKRVMLPPELW